jgi:hypothetical protein
MSARQVTEESAAPVPESPQQARAEAGVSDPVAYVLALQRSAGNAAVVRYLGRTASTASNGTARQRARVSHAPTQLARIHRIREACEQERRLGTQPEVAVRRVLARWPGDGMAPPGDCPWATYLPLRLSVESAKAITSMLGACSPGDSCTFLATKIAAISAEIAARVALDTTCFRGGDTGHRQQVQDKINMLNRCHRFFQNGNCPQALLTAMAAVVAAARHVVEQAAMMVAAAVIVAAVVALVVAIIALVEAIAAIAAAVAAAAAEAAAIAAAVAALAALLVVIKEQLAPAAEPSGA